MRILSIPLLLAALLVIIWQCDTPSVRQTASANGEKWSRIHCAGCHAYPEPSLLDSTTWARYILPRMGYMLGIYPDSVPRESLLEKGIGGQRVVQANVFPAAPLIEDSIWLGIVAYYLREAPKALPDGSHPKPAAEQNLFRAKRPALRMAPPSTTLLHWDEATRRLYLGDANSQALHVLDNQLNYLGAANTREGLVWMEVGPGELYLLVMGSFSPTDAPSGFLMALPTTGGGQPAILIDSLQRPVHFAHADLNADGRKDWVICEFGKWTGRLAWWEQLPDGSYRPHTLRQTPGAIKSYIQDLNGDNLPDVLALFGQGQETIAAYLNRGDGSFETKNLLSLPPSNGSSSLSLVDWDGDQRVDLLYTAGDNADYPPLYKPYHGIYLFLQRDGLRFEQAFHYPLHGAYGAVPADFDQDGDLDLAAISFFPNFQTLPEEGFVYLENQGQNQFKATTIPEVLDGRWIVLESGDLDQDGDLDLLLGSLTFEVVPPMGLVEKWTQGALPFLLLENTLK